MCCSIFHYHMNICIHCFSFLAFFLWMSYGQERVIWQEVEVLLPPHPVTEGLWARNPCSPFSPSLCRAWLPACVLVISSTLTCWPAPGASSLRAPPHPWSPQLIQSSCCKVPRPPPPVTALAISLTNTNMLLLLKRQSTVYALVRTRYKKHPCNSFLVSKRNLFRLTEEFFLNPNLDERTKIVFIINIFLLSSSKSLIILKIKMFIKTNKCIFQFISLFLLLFFIYYLTPSSCFKHKISYGYHIWYLYIYTYSSQHLKWIRNFHQSCSKTKTLMNFFDPLQMCIYIYILSSVKITFKTIQINVYFCNI